VLHGQGPNFERCRSSVNAASLRVSTLTSSLFLGQVWGSAALSILFGGTGETQCSRVRHLADEVHFDRGEQGSAAGSEKKPRVDQLATWPAEARGERGKTCATLWARLRGSMRPAVTLALPSDDPDTVREENLQW